MLKSWVLLSVTRRGVVLVVWCIILATTVLMLPQLAIDAIPDVTNVQVTVITASPGLSAEEAEQYITYPIEMAMSGLPRVVQVRSISRAAVSSVTLVFKDGTDLWFARQMVSERLQEATKDIPANLGSPSLAPVSTGLGEIYQFYLHSTTRSPTELRTLLDWNVAQALREVPGVVEVNAMGGGVKEYQVIASPQRMAAHGVTLQMLCDALRNNNLNVGSGYIEKDMEAYMIRGQAQITGEQDIANIAITADADGTPTLVKQVADVSRGTALRFGAVTKAGEGEIVAGTVMMLVGSNSRDVVQRVKERIEKLRKQLPADVQIDAYYDRSEFIDRTLHTVFSNLIEGAFLVVLVLSLALGSLRAALVAAAAIPFSMGLTVLLMIATHVTGNLMSLGAIDFGLLVDGAIVMLEAALMSLATGTHHDADADPEAFATAVANAMGRMARPVLFSLLIILLVYLPLMTLEGTEGRMFQPMAITIVYALGAALAFSLTGAPALAAYILPRKIAHTQGWMDALAKRYAVALDALLSNTKRTYCGVFAVLLLSLVPAARLGAEFLPRLDEGEILLDVRRLPSISITAAQRLGVEVEKVLETFPEVISVVTKTGRAEVATDPVGADETNVMVKLTPRDTWTTAHDLDSLGEALQKAIVARVPATTVSVTQPIEDSVNQLLAGSRSDVAVKLMGDDLTVLKATADAMAERIATVPGTGDFRVQRVLGLPALTLRPDRARLARYGLNAADVLDVVEASRLGKSVGRVFEGSKRFDLRVMLPPASLTPEGFGELLVSTPSGQLLPLASVADIEMSEGPPVIFRENLKRRIMLEINVRGRDLVSYVTEAQNRLADVQLPEGVTVVWGGQFENFSRAKDRLLLVIPAVIALIFGMLFLMFGEAALAACVFVAVPFAVGGGVLALWLRQMPFSIPAAVGFIAVGGVSVLNGVVMASRVAELSSSGHLHPVRAGALAAFRPMLTTALVAAIGFLPMALSTHAGSEVQRPLATVVVGGIVLSTLLTLAVLPALLRLSLRRP